MTVDTLDRRFELVGVNQQIVGKAEIMQDGEPAVEILAQAIIAFGHPLQDLTQTHGLGLLGKPRHLFGGIVGGEIEPADDAEDPVVLRGVLEEEFVFRFLGARLHRDDAVDLMLIEERLQIGRGKVAFQHRHVAPDPRISLGRVVPEVMMGIDAHGLRKSFRVTESPPTTRNCTASSRSLANHFSNGGSIIFSTPGSAEDGVRISLQGGQSLQRRLVRQGASDLLLHRFPKVFLLRHARAYHGVVTFTIPRRGPITSRSHKAPFRNAATRPHRPRRECPGIVSHRPRCDSRRRA